MLLFPASGALKDASIVGGFVGSAGVSISVSFDGTMDWELMAIALLICLDAVRVFSLNRK